MEKIQKALEKARQQRTGATPQRLREAARAPMGNEPGAGRVLAAGHAPAGGGELAVGGDPGEIVYSETRVIVPSADALEAGRVVAGPATFNDELVDTFRVLRTQVLQRLTAAGYSTLAVTSANRGEGKSLTAINLAMSLALHVSHTVLLVDLDLRRPRVHSYFGLEPELGLTDFLVDDVPIADCFINPGVDRLVLLPIRAALKGSSELLSAPKMLTLAEELKSRYQDRFVIYDLPPVLVSDDALAFLQHVDCCLFVIEDGVTSKADIQRSLDLLKDCHILGTVLNKSINGMKPYSYED